jgi:CO/xanthine dehydrogenase Mo-binding subunit
MGAIGVSTPRRDSEPKVRGTTRFAADVPVPGLLHARLVLAHEVHATISKVRTDAAEALGGVVAVLTAGDLPLVGTGLGRLNEPLAREEVVYAGQPVALVVAESEALAEDGAELVQVELEPLEPVLELEAAARPGSPLVRVKPRAAGAGSDIGDAHASVSAGRIGEGEQLSANVLGTARLANGDVDAALAASHVVVRGRFTTPWIHQGYLEPQTATAWLEPDGELIVRSATQAPSATRDALAKLFGLPARSWRVRCAGAPCKGSDGRSWRSWLTTAMASSRRAPSSTTRCQPRASPRRSTPKSSRSRRPRDRTAPKASARHPS